MRTGGRYKRDEKGNVELVEKPTQPRQKTAAKKAAPKKPK